MIKNALVVLAFVVGIVAGIHWQVVVPHQWHDRMWNLHDNSEAVPMSAPVYELNEVDVTALAPAPIIQKSIDEGYGQPIQRQIQIDLDMECLDQLEYYEGERKRGDDDPFIDFRIEQLKDRCG